MLILQECCTDATGSYVIYAPVDVVAMNVVLNGGDPDYVALLPSGFAILPDGPGAGATGGGSSNSAAVLCQRRLMIPAATGGARQHIRRKYRYPSSEYRTRSRSHRRTRPRSWRATATKA